MITPTFLWPVPVYYAVSSGFNAARDYGYHNAIDIPAPISTPIVAVAAGRVAFAGTAGDCGMAVFIDHDGGWRSHYCHLNMWRVTAGQLVFQGQHIGDVGVSGAVLGAHLHLNLFSPTALPGSRYVAWVGKWAVDPVQYLRQQREIDMFLLYVHPSGSVYLVGPEGKRWMPTMALVGIYAAAGLPRVDVTDAQAVLIPNA